MQTADKANCPLVLANDPDADRLAVAEKQRELKKKVGEREGLSVCVCVCVCMNPKER